MSVGSLRRSPQTRSRRRPDVGYPALEFDARWDTGGQRERASVSETADRERPESGAGVVAGEAQTPPPRTGELNQAITSALVGIHTKYLGRGPQRASTFYHDNVIVTLMYGVLTRAERALVETNHGEAVTQLRHLMQQTMTADFREAIERLTGRKVLAFISGTNLDPDVASAVFVLDRPV
jgi:uncharacterized protein YbcI